MNLKVFIKRLKNVGPGAIVAAAIIGPGTVTTASVAGAEYGFALIWGLVFAVIVTIFLLEMATRLGIISRKSLGTALREQFKNPLLKYGVITLSILAIGGGTIASQSGNLAGGAVGLEIITGIPTRVGGAIIGITIALLLWKGSYKVLEKAFIVMVLILTISFAITAIFVKPSISSIFSSFFPPMIPDGSILVLISLIGTTVVPYTLFLQSATVQERWMGKESLPESRFDIVTSMIVVGIVSIAILVTSAVAFPIGTSLSSGADMAIQLEPLLGSWATIVFSIGIFAAGASSAMAAPLAAAYALSGLLNWKEDVKSWKFRIVWLSVITFGITFSTLGYSPVELIMVTRYAIGLILPLIIIFLIFVMNNKKYLGEHTNKTWLNIISCVIFIITFILSLQSFGIF